MKRKLSPETLKRIEAGKGKFFPHFAPADLPHTCGVEGCGKKFGAGGRASLEDPTLARCPMHYHRERRGSKLTLQAGPRVAGIRREVYVPPKLDRVLVLLANARKCKVVDLLIEFANEACGVRTATALDTTAPNGARSATAGKGTITIPKGGAPKGNRNGAGNKGKTRSARLAAIRAQFE